MTTLLLGIFSKRGRGRISALIHYIISCKATPLLAFIMAYSITISGYGQLITPIDPINGSSTMLNTGWVFKKATELSSNQKAGKWAQPGESLESWDAAVVPGTVLTSLLHNGKIPDPFFGMNNEQIVDVYTAGKDYYTYWFVKDFDIDCNSRNGRQFLLHLRGVNYGFDAYLNGHRLNDNTLKGMFIRRYFNITKLLNTSGPNRLAIIVYPPDHVGDPNGGQGGDGTIARGVTNQYVAGWDWIQPVRDRNTGIWDKVWISTVGDIEIADPHVITEVPGKRTPEVSQQAPAIIHSSVRLHNWRDHKVSGTAVFEIAGHRISKKVTIGPNDTQMVKLPSKTLDNPILWWPAGMGITGEDQFPHLYTSHFEFIDDAGELSDRLELKVGVRQIDHEWNERTRSTQVMVNGQRLFIRGGNWIASDAMLRFSKERYDSEVRFHRDMGLNLIRVWGGGLTERPEFYEACDRYGLLVMQDFWGSGDCNGRWQDPKKKDDIWTRRAYPDDHHLFIESAADQIKLLRNHPSLAIWCGGNEITLPSDIENDLHDSLLPMLDPNRWYIDFSNSDSMSFNSLGGNGDGPYGIQQLETFWEHRTYPFNSEIGSVGLGDMQSLQRFLPQSSLPSELPNSDNNYGLDNSTLIDSVWKYHKYIGYNNSVNRYGKPTDTKTFAKVCQLVNYNQYRALMEGFTGHQWDWYTGFIIWKTQNPWTAMRGQMYDYYLDPNAGLYGLKKASERIHLMFNPSDSGIYIVNNSYQTARNLILEIRTCSIEGQQRIITRTITQAIPQLPKLLMSVKKVLNNDDAEEGLLLSLRLLDLNKNIISDNLYWTKDRQGGYSGLANMPSSKLQVVAQWVQQKNKKERIQLILSCPEQGAPSFFNRISIINKVTGKRILPTFYSDNYISILPGESATVYIDPPSNNLQSVMVHPADQQGMFRPTEQALMEVNIEGWNTDEITVPIKKRQ